MGERIDFEAEGLLEGLESEAREGRVKLLAELAADGVPLAELREAVTEHRLALLPIERAIAGGGARYTAAQVAERTGITPELVGRIWRALGMATAEPDAAIYTEADIEASGRLARLLEIGLPTDGVLEAARVIGMTMAQVVAANRSLVGESFVGPEDTEYEAGRRLGAVAELTLPMIGPILEHVYALNLREQIRRDVWVGAGRQAAGEDVGACFVDMVDFTKLGEELPASDLGAVAGRLDKLVADLVEPPVRLVKMIGDAAMLVARQDPVPVLATALDVVEAAEAEGEDFPQLKAGVAFGPALSRSGDWYGNTINLASRITSIARPGTVLVSAPVRKLAEDGEFSFTPAGRRGLKGFAERVPVFRTRRAPQGPS